jgi:Nucleotidyl transferase AbiEii toxin, Type IV TA system
MVDKKTNIGASVRQRLLNLSRKDGSDFQVLLTRYVLERLLYRLGISPLRDEFVLKGAMLHPVWLKNPYRYTRDLDLHAHGEEDADMALRAFKTILAAAVDDDGIIFDVDGLVAEPIRENASYGGVRLSTSAKLGGARIPVRVDLGFGDAITPRPELTDYPSLLDLPRPRLLTYPRETAIAEKFEAMVSLGLTNSRMKDFHDVAMLAANFSFEDKQLAAAIAATFKRRGTPLPKEAPPALTDAFTKRPETMALWKAFVERETIRDEFSDLDLVIRLLRSFLLEPAVTILNDTGFAAHWPPGGPWSK